MSHTEGTASLGVAALAFVAGLIYYGGSAFTFIDVTNSRLAMEDRTVCEAQAEQHFFGQAVDQAGKTADIARCMKQDGRRIFK